MTFLSCNNVNERVKFKAQPHDSYVIEYGDGELYLSTENSKSKERYFLKENKYFSDEDSSVFLALKDTFFYTYNAFFKQIMMHRIRRIKNNVFVSELYDISCLNEIDENQKHINSTGSNQKESNLVSAFYYDMNYRIFRIERPYYATFFEAEEKEYLSR